MKVTINETEAAYRLVDGVGFECQHLDTTTEIVDGWDTDYSYEVETCVDCGETLETL